MNNENCKPTDISISIVGSNNHLIKQTNQQIKHTYSKQQKEFLFQNYKLGEICEEHLTERLTVKTKDINITSLKV